MKPRRHLVRQRQACEALDVFVPVGEITEEWAEELATLTLEHPGLWVLNLHLVRSCDRCGRQHARVYRLTHRVAPVPEVLAFLEPYLGRT